MQLVDWSLAVRTASALVPPGPSIGPDEARAVVADLERLAAEAEGHVTRYTGLDTAPASARTVVVDRPAWIAANVESFARLADPAIETLLRKRPANPLVMLVGSKATGVEVGLLLSFLATRVLGQFELLGPAGGRLTLVAPNVVDAEQRLGVDPHDFRLWVCLHEVTHRTQFASAPWLHDHVQGLMRSWLEASDLDPSALARRLQQAVKGLADVARGRGSTSVVELFQTPAQKEVLDRITGLMSLLEGHADVVMDEVGPQVVPTVATIRERFEQRRSSGGPLGAALRRLLGLEMKMKQYREGARFVRAVVDAVGMDAFNVVWTSPDLLPTAAEIREPESWLARVRPAELTSA